MVTWTIHPRDTDLGRTLDPLSDWTRLDVVERHNRPDTWVLKGPTRALSAFTAGMGAILQQAWVDSAGVTHTDQITSGKARLLGRDMRYDPDRGETVDEITLGFIADTKRLWNRRCYPDPSHALSSTASTFSTAHDTRTGTREDIILDVIADNLGPAAGVVARRLSTLALPTSLARGGTTTRKFRMDNLGDAVAELAEQAGLRVRIVHDESTGSPRLLLRIDDAPDVSANVIFGTPEVAAATAGHLVALKYQLEAPEVTHAIAWAAGEKTEREATLLSDSAAVALWGERVEDVVDQRHTDDPDDIADALTDRLADGASPVSMEFSVLPGRDARLRQHYDVGYRVGVEIPDLPEAVSDNTIREVSTTVTGDGDDAVSIVVGTPGARSNSNRDAARLNRALERIARLERGY